MFNTVYMIIHETEENGLPIIVGIINKSLTNVAQICCILFNIECLRKDSKKLTDKVVKK